MKLKEIKNPQIQFLRYKVEILFIPWRSFKPGTLETALPFATQTIKLFEYHIEKFAKR